jgi:hypothetical protein
LARLTFVCFLVELATPGWLPGQAVDPAPVPALGAERDWGPEQATGPPDTFRAGDIVTAWASRTDDGQPEWLLLRFAKPVRPSGLLIYETYNPGAVHRVSLFQADGTEIVAWSGEDPTPPGSEKGISAIPLKADFLVDQVRIHLDSPAVKGWNEIDAVGLRGLERKTQWAIAAQASSTYAKEAARDPLVAAAAQDPFGGAADNPFADAGEPKQVVEQPAAAVELPSPIAMQPPGRDEESEKEPRLPEGRIEEWINELAADSFVTRENAMRSLVTAGKMAVPEVAEAAGHDSLEVRWRCFHILLVLSNRSDADTSIAAVDAIHAMSKSPNALVSRNAKDALRRIREHAVTALIGLSPGLGLDDQGRVSTVNLSLQQVTDPQLRHLRGLTELESLDLSGTGIGDSGLAHIKGLTRLKKLKLIHTPITDAGLAHLKRLTALEELNLFATNVTDSGLIHLVGLPRLKTLTLNSTKVSDDGVRKLKQAMPRCRIMASL